MAEFQKSPERQSNAPEQRSIKDLFNLDQWENMVEGIYGQFLGAQQLVDQIKEASGVVPKGTTAFNTQESRKDLEILREQNVGQHLRGAGGFKVAGDVLPLLLTPIGRSIPTGAASGFAIGAVGFQEESNPKLEDRLPRAAGTAVFGAALGKLLKRGPAGEAAAKTIEDMKLLTHQKKLTNQSVIVPPAPAQQAARGIRELDRSQQKRLTHQPTGRLPSPAAVDAGLPASRKAFDLLDPTTARNIPKGFAASLKADVAQMAKFKDDVLRTRAGVIKDVKKIRAGAEKVIKDAKGKTTPASTVAKETKAASTLAIDALQKEMKAVVKAVKSVPKNIKAKDPILLAEIEAGTVGKKMKDMTRADLLKERQLTTDPVSVSTKDLKAMVSRQRNEDRVAAKAAREAGDTSLGGSQRGAASAAGVNIAGGAVAGGVLGGLATGEPEGIIAGALAGGLGGKFLSSLAPTKFTSTTPKAKAAAKKDLRANAGESQALEAAMQDAINTKTPNRWGDFSAAVNRVMNNFAGAVDTRLGQLSVPVQSALRQTEARIHRISGEYIQGAENFFAKLDKSALTDAQFATVKALALTDTRKAVTYLRAKGATQAAEALEFEVQPLVKQFETYLTDMGFALNFKAGYFPRSVKDSTFFRNDPAVVQDLAAAAKRKGRELTDDEINTTINSYFQRAVAGRQTQTYAKASKNMLNRKHQVVGASRVNAYEDLNQSWNMYIQSIVHQAERQKFFKGLGAGEVQVNGENLNAVTQLLARELKKTDGANLKDMDEIGFILHSRFGAGEMAPSKVVQGFKNFTYTALLANPIAALTQLGDIALSFYKNGIGNTIRAMGTAFQGATGPIRSGLDKKTLLGLTDASAEMASGAFGSRQILNWGLKYSGFRAMDTFGKNTFINAAMLKNQQMTKEAFMTKWAPIFDPEVPAGQLAKRTEGLFEKTKNFQKIDDTNKDDIGFMLWNELSEVQPISLSQLPKVYLDNPNGRMAYMLKSFSLKVLDVMRKDIIHEWKAGNKIKAAKNAAMFGGLFGLVNGSVDGLKQVALGRTIDAPEELFANNIVKMFGLSPFMVGTAFERGAGQAARDFASPPVALLDALTNVDKAVGVVPIVGRHMKEAVINAAK